MLVSRLVRGLGNSVLHRVGKIKKCVHRVKMVTESSAEVAIKAHKAPRGHGAIRVRSKKTTQICKTTGAFSVNIIACIPSIVDNVQTPITKFNNENFEHDQRITTLKRK